MNELLYLVKDILYMMFRPLYNFAAEIKAIKELYPTIHVTGAISNIAPLSPDSSA